MTLVAGIDVTTLSDADLAALGSAVTTEQVRRSTLVSIPLQVSQLNSVYLSANGQVQGAEWIRPRGAFNAYPLGWQVTHNGQLWQSTVDSNVWEPGVTAWTQITAPGALPAWVQPTGASDAYAVGVQVSHNGHAWTSRVGANVREPTAAVPTFWTDNGPIS